MRSVKAVLAMMVAGAVVACSEVAPTEPAMVAGEVEEARAPASLRVAASPTVVEVAVSVNAVTGEFSTLIAAVVAAGLVDELSAVGQRTVFAPTDEAFEALNLTAANVGTLPTEVLRNILLYHVAPGRRYERNVVGSRQIRMANGGFARVRVEGGSAYIDEARVVATDIEARNGVIHVIDGVLLP